jgi:hypothetical protein
MPACASALVELVGQIPKNLYQYTLVFSSHDFIYQPLVEPGMGPQFVQVLPAALRQGKVEAAAILWIGCPLDDVQLAKFPQ